MAKYQIETLLAAYKEKFDRDNFIKSLLMDNLLLIDIFDRSKKLHVELEVKRVAYLIELQKKNQDDAIGSIKNLFPDSQDFVTALDKKTIVVIKQLEAKTTESDLEKIAKKMVSVLKSDIGEEPIVAYGMTVEDLKDVSKSFKEAKMAQEVGKIFFQDRNVNSYNSLGIGRLIYQLPMPLCKLFISEIFRNVSLKDFDEETIETINKFFENSLNVSETSRQLFIHRNTLVYRLDKIQKITGLDLRVFDDAITFKIALMVSSYMQYVESLDYK
ncbi:MAG: helix-turn-helix domain-containing protein [Lachnospiraceae bacterium]|nr:helix-turn-helix domain-containing protein [Lachnospiraceae bacterium]